MGGRGSSSGLNGSEKPFSIPKVTNQQLKGMNRKQLETLATAIYANKSMAAGKTKADGISRAKSLMSSNSDAQLRKYIKKYGG